ncbi:MAG: formate--tetrahydrofolate ligase [Bacilli bacterium]|nr:formate--tetrahydrofolate ligase [Bacilli bacterium]
MDKLLNIKDIASKIGIENNIEMYGDYKAKIKDFKPKSNKQGKLILVTSINPTPAGEGKTTLSIGLQDSMRKLGLNSLVCLREPSLGPVFGSKGGAVGGGKAKVLPEDDINLHFNGDFHAITSANNLLCAIIDNHIYQGNCLDIKNVNFHRCLDVNDRELRNIELKNRKESFVITPASEIMAILCLAKDEEDLKNKLDNIIVGYNSKGEEILAKDLECTGALMLLLKDAIKPNLVQTLYNNPAIIHGGPFANIAHGCNSIIATKYALSISDYVITEAGFGSDCGALKFLDIKCRLNDIYPDVIVVNTTIKALKYHGNDDLVKGFQNLKFHIDLMKKYNDNVIVSLNKFDTDTAEEIDILKELVLKEDVSFVVSSMFIDGEDGCLDLANLIKDLSKVNTKHYEAYDINDLVENKINKVCNLYGASSVIYADDILDKVKKIDSSKYKNLPICIAKTPMSITDDKNLLGKPERFNMTVTDIYVEGGAGFIVVKMGNIMLMPGLGSKPRYLNYN